MPKPEPTMTEAAEQAIVVQLMQPESLPMRTTYQHKLDRLLEEAVDGHKLALVVVDLAYRGQPWAIKLVYDRLAGLPVQRLEAKLLAQVDDEARRIAREHGIDYEDVRAGARKLAQGT